MMTIRWNGLFAAKYWTVALLGMMTVSAACGGESTPATPVTVVAKAPETKHPLDDLIKLAEDGRARIQKEVEDYSAVLVRRERINGTLTDYAFLDAKFRNEKIEKDEVVTPFAVWLKFLKPAKVKDREVVWVKGANNGKMWVQETPLLGFKVPPVWILPTGPLAMAECKYPISDIGLVNLLGKLVEKGKADRDRNLPEECEVKTTKGAKIDGRSCTLYTIKHLKERPEYEFYLAEIFIDDELQIPVRYVAYKFPEDEKASPPIEEEYTYTKVKLNAGVPDETFVR